MALYYKHRTGHVTGAVGTATAVNVDDALGTSDINTPGDVSMLQGVWVALTNSIQNIADAGSNVLLIIKGDAIAKGAPHVIPVGSIADGTTSTEGKKVTPAWYIPLGIPIIPNQPLIMQAVQEGVDVGTPEISVTVVLT